MEDTQESKSKNPYLPWSTHETKTLLRLLVDGVNQNWADQNGSFSKLTVEQRILPELNRICGSKKTLLHYKNRTKILRGKYKSYADLLRFSSGFGWDSETKKFTAPDEVWEEYFKEHRKDKHLRDNSFEDYEDLHTIYGKNVAIGKNAMGLGDATDARTYGAENSEWDYQGGYTPQMMGDDDEDDDNNDGIEQVISSSSQRNANGKLPIRKKARTERFNVEKISDEISAVTGMNNQMFSMIQQRWQKEAEEKQAEEKNDNVWDAIKEVPDLEENERFDAMNLVHQLGMKAGFVKMTIDERREWIKRSVHKP
ncbi:unnamed protein product [Microthlaspi erraticum]|uniref:Uncharacterized protein n=1 Tax=Microthlaspi erraticum TaxID=1685480 RepID=A0A6D2KLA9_9BRAS|nr:unnamed protein product [Microthlaspi erraticum]